MANPSVSPKEATVYLMKGVVPERSNEIDALWSKYAPALVLVEDVGRITLAADKNHIEFDAKTMDVFWLIGFSSWRAIECYSPLVILSFQTGQPVADLIKRDNGLPHVERDYKERRAATQTLIETKDAASAPWPPDLPPPRTQREAIRSEQYKVAFYLTC